MSALSSCSSVPSSPAPLCDWSLGPQAQIGAAIYWPLDTDVTWLLHLKHDWFIHLQEPLTMLRDAVDPNAILGTLSVRWEYTWDRRSVHLRAPCMSVCTSVCKNRRNIHINIFIIVLDKKGWKKKHNKNCFQTISKYLTSKSAENQYNRTTASIILHFFRPVFTNPKLISNIQ